MINSDTIYDFETIINQKVVYILNNYVDYMSNDYQNYIKFYKGQIDFIPINSIQSYEKNLNDVSLLQENIRINLNRLQRSDFVELIEHFDTIFQNLQTVKVLSKILKSSKINEYDTGKVSQSVSLSASQTPESIHEDTGNGQNAWVDTFVKNRVYELNYEDGNGVILQKELSSNEQNFDVNSIIDNLSGEKLNGRDLDCNFSFTDDKSDIKVLDYQETISQSFKIAMQYKRGDHAYYPDAGLDPELTYGDIIQANLPFIVSDLSRTVSLDDVIQNFNISDIKSVDNSLGISANVQSLYGTTIENTITL